MKLIRFIQRYYGVFYWVGWLYIGLVVFVAESSGWPSWAQSLLLLPVNLIAWPVAFACWDEKARTKQKIFQYDRMVRRAVVAQLIISTIMPLVLLAM